MRCSIVLLAMLAAVPPVSAQPFPAPGTGVFTWETVGDRPLKALGVAFGADGTFYAGTLDSSFVYEPAPAGPPTGRWRSLGYARNTVEVVLPLDPGGDTLLAGGLIGGLLLRSVDRGTTWIIVNGCFSGCDTGGPSRPGGFLALPPGHVHAGRLLAGGPLLYSDDRGATWTRADDNVPVAIYPDAYAFAVLPSGRVLKAGHGGVAASDDGGASYATTPLYDRFITEGVAALATPGSTQTGTPSCGLADASLCDGAVAVTIEAAQPDVLAFRTNDGGRSWSDGVALPQPSDGIGVALVAGVVGLPEGPEGLGRALAVLGRGLVYRTVNGGQTWAAVGRLPLDISEGIHFATYVLLGPDGHLWVVTTKAGPSLSHIYRSSEPAEAAFPVAGEGAAPSERGARIEVRPNPSSSRVVVRLALGAGASSTTTAVYDRLGRAVAVVHKGALAAGVREVVVDTSRLAAGVYTVRHWSQPESGPATTTSATFTVTGR